MSCNYSFEYIPAQGVTPIVSSLIGFPCTSGSTVTPYKNNINVPQNIQNLSVICPSTIDQTFSIGESVSGSCYVPEQPPDTTKRLLFFGGISLGVIIIIVVIVVLVKKR
jgi:hypothetical protein